MNHAIERTNVFLQLRDFSRWCIPHGVGNVENDFDPFVSERSRMKDGGHFEKGRTSSPIVFPWFAIDLVNSVRNQDVQHGHCSVGNDHKRSPVFR